jgi:hypothetical protein
MAPFLFVEESLVGTLDPDKDTVTQTDKKSLPDMQLEIMLSPSAVSSLIK